MSSEKKFGALRMALRALGLSQESVDDVVDWIVDLLAGDSKESTNTQGPEYPYNLRDDFLSAAELSFYKVLVTTLNGSAVVCAKVGLGDLFWVSRKDRSIYLKYTNKIDRKHVDFLLCEPTTMQPLVGIELDDKSHQREDRRVRDEFVNEVFKAAKLPLVHVPVRRAYNTADITDAVKPYLGNGSDSLKDLANDAPQDFDASRQEAPRCPKCGGEMILRTARHGTNAGNQFWGCSNYPRCRSILPYEV